MIVIAIAALGVAGCSGDDDSAGKSSLPDDGELLDEDEYIAVFSSSVQDSDTGFGAAPDEADCAAEAAVASVGAERLQAAGLDEAWLTTEVSPATDLTEEESDAIVDALFDCIDMGSAIAASLAADEDGLPRTTSVCLSDALGEGTVLRSYLARLLREGNDVPMSVDEASAFVDATLACIDFGPFRRRLHRSERRVADARSAGVHLRAASQQRRLPRPARVRTQRE